MTSVIVSKEIVLHLKRIGWAYRESPNYKGDSGWRLFSGEETQDYSDNPDNFEIYNIASILDIDSTFLEILDEAVGSEYEKLANSSVWRKVNSNPEPNGLI